MLVERDPLAVQAVREAVAELKGYALVAFTDFAAYLAWLTIPADKRGTDPAPAAVKILVWSAEELKSEPVKTWVTRSNAAGVAAGAPVLITTFEPPDVSLTKWTASGAFNLLIKPFDPLLLRQNLRVALNDQELGSESTVHQMKTAARIESLKSVPMVELSEIGFMTRSEMQLPLGRPAKYYGEIFSYNDVRSLYARTLDQTADAASKSWLVRLTFYGPNRDQSLRMRGRFPPKEIPGSWPKAAAAAKIRFMIIADPSPAGSELSGTFTRNFTNVEALPLADLPDAKFAPPGPIDAVFVHKDYLDRVLKDDRFKTVKKIAITEKLLPEEDLRRISASTIDIVFLPMERVSFYKKLQVLFPALQASEERAIKTYEWKETLNVGQPVEIVEMSEASLVERYERAFEPGTIRRFILWYPAEKDTPVLTGRCYKSEKDPSKPDSFLNFFVFFGVSDRESKHIRLWIRDHYIMSKQKG